DDNGATSLPATVTVVGNQAGTVNGDFSETDGTTPVTINVLDNDSAPGGAILVPNSVKVVDTPAHGPATVNSDGSITYVASARFTGTDRFNYTVTDSKGVTSAPTPVFVRVNAPTATDDLASFSGTTPVTINVLANDTDPDGNQHILTNSVTLVSAPVNGHAQVNADGTITYTANPGFNGADQFQYTVPDRHGPPPLPAAVTVVGSQAGAVNGDFSDTDGTTPVTIDVLANDSASGGATLVPSSVKVVGAAAHGFTTVNTDGSITYVASAKFMG